MIHDYRGLIMKHVNFPPTERQQTQGTGTFFGQMVNTEINFA